MRITNKMMNDVSYGNMNTNKGYLDKLNNQMSTEKKLSRPSDDSVVAIRALRLRANLSEVTQYFGANVPDAVAWVDVTQKAIDSTVDILSSMKALCDQGANGINDASARTRIYEELLGSVKQVYQNGNTNYAGRTVFTGNRTSLNLTFSEDTIADYRGITDRFNASDVKIASYVESPLTMEEINTYDTSSINEIDVKEDRVNRIRLSYNNINETVKKGKTAGIAGVEAGSISGWGSTESLDQYYDQDGKLINTGTAWEMTLGGSGTNIITTPSDPYNQGLKPMGSDPSMENVTELNFWPENSYYGNANISGNVYATRAYDNTELIYRTELSGTPSIDQSGVETKPEDGVQSFKIQYGGNTYTIKKFPGQETTLKDVKTPDRFLAVDASGNVLTDTDSVTGDVYEKMEVTRNSDGTFTLKEMADSKGTSGNVFNVSANGRTVTSCYEEHALAVQITTSDATVITDSDGNDLTAYQYLALDPNDQNITRPDAADKIYLLADTGELVFGSGVAKTLSTLKDIDGVDTISVAYDKSEFKQGDLRPEHYFNAKEITSLRSVADPLVYDNYEQSMYYTVGSGQNIKINTNAKDLFDTQIARETDDIIGAIEGYNATEEKVNRLKAMQKDTTTYGEADQEKISLLLDAANKELDIAKNKLQSVYERGITSFGKFHEQANLAGTDCGAVDNRLTLISNRLQEEKTSITTQASDNENVDITNVAVEVKEAELVYNAALMATGKISQHSLLNYL
ncbi:MAG: hypothetical protein K6F35_12935 [Lachnospiraceae bacterium]|nr:hypothetical protein [Lachnospiraceae bacterium]